MEHIGQALLAEKELVKLGIFSKVFQQGIVLKSYLVDEYNLTVQRLGTIITELNHDLAMVGSTVIVESDGHVIMPSDVLNDHHYVTILNELERLYYLHSNRYLLLCHLLEERVSTSIELSKKLNLSHSYTYKISEDVNRFFEDTHLSIQIKRNKGQWSIEGNEYELRIIDFLLHQFSYNLMIDEVDSRLPTQHQRSDKLNPCSIQKYQVFTNICQTAQTRNCELVHVSDEAKFFFDILTVYFPEMKTTETPMPEQVFYWVMIIFFIPELMSAEDKTAIGRLLWESPKKFKLLAIIDQVTTIAIKHQFVAESDMFDFCYELFSHYIVYHDFSYWKFLMTPADYSYCSPAQYALYEDIQMNVSTRLSKPLETILMKRSVELSLGYRQIQPSNVLKVYIMFYYRVLDRGIIKNLIVSTYNTDVVMVCDTLAEADVVVTDVVLKQINDDNYFYFSNIKDSCNWVRLNTFLQQRIMSRRFI
ncbi:helix-turn-helix domain-containing protein [Vagococcus vulneris]|uniref:Mga helix-turn-helix domain-containing protein n=1 Tax=Vagococcus vulneris TaxID=1977869 RepID=A0A429ZYB5_9ENTE|nr:helix-turn-helix domain-containing protein [Vagococcus vulneris]RST98936.1 hypothetical protein CBF37_06090 [Vagococcus vulneris]